MSVSVPPSTNKNPANWLQEYRGWLSKITRKRSTVGPSPFIGVPPINSAPGQPTSTPASPSSASLLGTPDIPDDFWWEYVDSPPRAPPSISSSIPPTSSSNLSSSSSAPSPVLPQPPQTPGGPSTPASVPVLLFLVPLGGTVDAYFRQLSVLPQYGIRVISADPPPYPTLEAFCAGLDSFLLSLGIRHPVHLFGAGLGGLLAQVFAFRYPTRVASLVLCNSFSDTGYYARRRGVWHHLLPAGLAPDVLLHRAVLSAYDPTAVLPSIATSIDFMVAQLERCSKSRLSSRLMLMCQETGDSSVMRGGRGSAPNGIYEVPLLGPLQLPDSRITLLDTIDEHGRPETLRDDIQKRYPECRLATLKTGGDFPFLSRGDEVNLHIAIHLRLVLEQLQLQQQLELQKQPPQASISSPSAAVVDGEHSLSAVDGGIPAPLDLPSELTPDAEAESDEDSLAPKIRSAFAQGKPSPISSSIESPQIEHKSSNVGGDMF